MIANEGAGALLTGLGPTVLGYSLQGAFKFGGLVARIVLAFLVMECRELIFPSSVRETYYIHHNPNHITSTQTKQSISFSCLTVAPLL